MPHLDVPGARLYYETAGHASAEPLLLIHAGIANLRMWDPLVDALAADHSVIRYDTRYFGRTTAGADDYSNRDDVRAILDHLGVQRATFIGASRGGGISIDVALETPERVAAIVTFGSGANGMPDTEMTDEEERLCTAIDAAWEAGDHAAMIDLDTQLWSIGPLRNEADLDQEFVAAAYALNRANLHHTGEKRGRHLDLEPSAFERVVELDVPALVTVGEFDITSALLDYAFLAETVPGADSHLFRETAHLPSVERAGETRDLILPWLTERGL